MTKDRVSRRDFLRAVGLGAAGFTISGCADIFEKPAFAAGNQPDKPLPNILILMTDQQRFDSLGCYGGNIVDTPNIDRLAKEGSLFEYCYSACPVCTPVRASMMTGKSVPGHGVYKLHDILPDDQVLFPKYLQKLGYQTSLVGKLHVSGLWQEAEKRHPNDGFDNYEWCVDPGLNFESKFNAYARWVKSKDPKFYERLKEEGKNLHHFPDHVHFSRWASETTIQLVRKRDKNRPFFALVSLFDPHDPYFDHPLESAQLVKERNIPEPQPIPSDKNMPAGVRRELEKSTIIKNKSATFKDSIHDLRKGYYASIAFFDQEFGKILDSLDQEGLADNTLVIFISDHGDMLWDRGLFTKGAFFYDPSIRVPLLMRYPGRIPPGIRVKSLVQHYDLAATALSAAGFTKEKLKQIMPEAMDLMALIREGKAYKNYRDYGVCVYRNTGYGPGHTYFDPPIHCTMFRDERFKLNVYHGPSRDSRPEGELYDMRNDPAEANNLWAEPGYAEVRTRLLGRLSDWMVENDVRYFGSRGGEKFFTLKKGYYGDEK